MRESVLAGPLRWDYTVDGERNRREVTPRMVVRRTPADAVDPVLERRALDKLKERAAELQLAPSSPGERALSVGEAYRLFFDPRRKALPPSREARAHHTASREFWTDALGAGTPWDAVTPNDVKAALLGLKERGMIPTAEKRLANLRTLYRWLGADMALDRLRDPTRGVDKGKLLTGHRPRRPRYTTAEVERLVEASRAFGERAALFTALLADSGARAVQVRHAMRSGLDVQLEPMPPVGDAPCGWLMLPAVKGQEPMLTYLTARQRGALDAALTTYLAPWEAAWTESGADYPLIPGGRTDGRGSMLRQPISDRAMRDTWAGIEAGAKIPPKERRGFHGVRRAWADDVESAEGLDTVTAAGGWSRRETVEGVYLSKIRYSHLEKARARRERGE